MVNVAENVEKLMGCRKRKSVIVKTCMLTAFEIVSLQKHLVEIECMFLGSSGDDRNLFKKLSILLLRSELDKLLF